MSCYTSLVSMVRRRSLFKFASATDMNVLRNTDETTANGPFDDDVSLDFSGLHGLYAARTCLIGIDGCQTGSDTMGGSPGKTVVIWLRIMESQRAASCCLWKW